MAAICVFCGSRSGNDPVYMSAAADMGTALARAGHTVIYGAGNVGLMGSVADAALAAGGRVIGVIPRLLVDQEVCHRGLTELLVVEDMHTRKRLMCERSDAFVVLPGGIGTIDELSEVMCWNQLGIHTKRVAFLDVAGYWSPFLGFLEGMAAAGFIPVREGTDLLVCDQADGLLARLCPRSV
jgi:uncharacterized protein (TIGR00730 family)